MDVAVVYLSVFFLFIDGVTFVTRLLASYCVQTLRQTNVILSRHSEFQKMKQTVEIFKCKKDWPAELYQS